MWNVGRGAAAEPNQNRSGAQPCSCRRRPWQSGAALRSGTKVVGGGCLSKSIIGDDGELLKADADARDILPRNVAKKKRTGVRPLYREQTFWITMGGFTVLSLLPFLLPALNLPPINSLNDGCTLYGFLQFAALVASAKLWKVNRPVAFGLLAGAFIALIFLPIIFGDWIIFNLSNSRLFLSIVGTLLSALPSRHQR